MYLEEADPYFRMMDEELDAFSPEFKSATRNMRAFETLIARTTHVFCSQ